MSAEEGTIIAVNWDQYMEKTMNTSVPEGSISATVPNTHPWGGCYNVMRANDVFLDFLKDQGVRYAVWKNEMETL